jgi:hypothetical protein
MGCRSSNYHVPRPLPLPPPHRTPETWAGGGGGLECGGWFLHFPRSRGEGERASDGQTPWLNGRPTNSDSISDQWSKVRNIAIFRKKFRNDLNQNIDQKADIWSKPSKDRKFFENSGYWGRRQVAKNGFVEVFWCLVEICPPLKASLLYILTVHLWESIIKMGQHLNIFIFIFLAVCGNAAIVSGNS